MLHDRARDSFGIRRLRRGIAASSELHRFASKWTADIDAGIDRMPYDDSGPMPGIADISEQARIIHHLLDGPIPGYEDELAGYLAGRVQRGSRATNGEFKVYRLEQALAKSYKDPLAGLVEEMQPHALIFIDRARVLLETPRKLSEGGVGRFIVHNEIALLLREYRKEAAREVTNRLWRERGSRPNVSCMTESEIEANIDELSSEAFDEDGLAIRVDLQAALARLPAKQRAAVLVAINNPYSPRKWRAERMGVAETTLKQNYDLALVKLRTMLKESS